MAPLPIELRKQLEKTVIEAREVAERGARAALNVLGVRGEPPHPFPEQNALRLQLRARSAQLGGTVADTHSPPLHPRDRGWAPLEEEIAYHQWHRMLFARFLAENNLLIHPQYGVEVTLQECAELAEAEGEPDAWAAAEKYAGAMLPGIFRRDDPSAQVQFAANDRQALETLLNALPAVLFQSDDALGWVYQFWQTKTKKEINASGRKIGGADIGPVTQLFTEDYMVRFLLENSLGAWWAVRHPASPLLKGWEYLRYREDSGHRTQDSGHSANSVLGPQSSALRTPAAGTFPGWPEHAKDVTVMDPCCGSGHFLVAAAGMLRAMRMEEEGLTEAEAAEAVLRENIFGLEIDPRCTQIAAFALVFDGWKNGLPVRSGAPLVPNIACSGVPVTGQLSEWTKLAGRDTNLKLTLERLYDLFKDAPDLGSLIDPNNIPAADRMFLKDYSEVAHLVEAATADATDDPAAAVFGATAQGVARAGDLLARRYTLVATNPPYLSRGKQGEALRAFADSHHKEAKADLATMFIERCRAFAEDAGGYAMVTPQNWLFLGSYKKLRERLLKEQAWGHVARLGEGGFESTAAAGAFTILVVLADARPGPCHEMTGIDASAPKESAEKAALLRDGPIAVVEQAAQLRNPDAVVSLAALSLDTLVKDVAQTSSGVQSGDNSHWVRCFWEVARVNSGWAMQQTGPESTGAYNGREHIFLWEEGRGRHFQFVAERLGAGSTKAWIRGEAFWGHDGVAVGLMRSLPCALYTGELTDDSVGVIVPRAPSDLSALWSFCSSTSFTPSLRAINQKVSVNTGYLGNIPFDLEYWQKEAERLYPDGLPEPHSDNPTQWLFKGNIVGSEAGLQVAVARLLGYKWPDQGLKTGDSGLSCEQLDGIVDEDGIVCMPAVNGEQPAAERLRGFLAAAFANPPYGKRPRGAPPWPTLPPTVNAWVDALLAQAGSAGKGLDEWLRDDFFAQHIKLFHNRPFIWQIWDGEKDGFSALVNYHRLDYAGLQKLIYVYLNWWIDVQRAGVASDVPGAGRRLGAAQSLQKKLELILEGEEPYDIYVRWKAVHEQPIGWNPDMDDGVRMNIRPFMLTCHPKKPGHPEPTGILRRLPNINWKKDRGRNPDGSERLNDLHLSLQLKREARANVGGGA